MSALPPKADIAPGTMTHWGRGAVQARLRTDRRTSLSTLRMPWTWSTRLRMTPTPSSLTPKSFFRSLISWARAMSASENVNSPADWPGMSHSSRIHISSVSRSRCARMATDSRCANEPFNVTNGDLIRWENLWPKIAFYFGMEVGPRQHIKLTEMMADKASLWDRIVGQHGLRRIPYDQIVSWGYGDFVFG